MKIIFFTLILILLTSCSTTSNKEIMKLYSGSKIPCLAEFKEIYSMPYEGHKYDCTEKSYTYYKIVKDKINE